MMLPFLICPYCNAKATCKDSSVVYSSGRDYGPIWVCDNYPSCNSYVGCHPGTKKPLGRLADKELRGWKVQAHAAFDPLWRRKINKEGCRKKDARGAGYAWLATRLDIPVDDCHIGMFDVARCRKVVEICRPYFSGQARGE